MDGAGWRLPTPEEHTAWEAFCATLAPLQRATPGSKRGAMRGVNAAHTHNPYETAPEIEDFGALFAEFHGEAAPKPTTPPQSSTQHSMPASVAQPNVTPTKISATQNSPLNPLGNVGLDARQLRALRRGKLRMDVVLDLHGHSVSAAFARLRTTVAQARRHGHRAVLVITGKGNARNPAANIGKLRAAMPHWLADHAIAPHVITAMPASLAHGGDGAWYLLLRRPERGPFPEERL